MEPWAWTLIIVLVLVLVVIPLIFQFAFLPPIIAKLVLSRRGPDHWAKNEPSEPKNEDMIAMWKAANDFRDEHKDVENDVWVESRDHLRLFGEFYDAGGDKAVIIVPGRPETLIYSAYYAKPYFDHGVSVMVFDPRAHGDSDGVWSGCGYGEKEDIRAFALWMAKNKGIKHIVLHGICVGSAACSFIAAEEDKPKEIDALVTDGAFLNFEEMLNRRLWRYSKLPPFIQMWAWRKRVKDLYGINIRKEGPCSNFPKIKMPTLMMASREDFYSLPKYTQQLYDSLGSEQKTMEWFDHGLHSHLRIAYTEHYDRAVQDFLDRTYGK